MRFLLDMGLAQHTARFLRDQGHDAVHLRDQGLQRLADEEIVLARSGRQPHPERLALLQAQSSWLSQALHTPNAAIGRVVVDRFEDDEDLVCRVAQQVEGAIAA